MDIRHEYAVENHRLGETRRLIDAIRDGLAAGLPAKRLSELVQSYDQWWATAPSLDSWLTLDVGQSEPEDDERQKLISERNTLLDRVALLEKTISAVSDYVTELSGDSVETFRHRKTRPAFKKLKPYTEEQLCCSCATMRMPPCSFCESGGDVCDDCKRPIDDCTCSDADAQPEGGA